MAAHCIGLMSGSSLDGVDGVIVRLAEGSALPQLVDHAHHPLPSPLAVQLLALNQSGCNELHRAALAANALMRLYADVVGQLLSRFYPGAAHITAIGAHGQTVRHQPQMHDGTGYTLQLANPALLAELTGITVVADFRSRDVAAGGQGAPLVPVFHQSVFGRSGQTTAVLNIGGIANLTVIGPQLADDLIGFDCGPGNVLMDNWCQRHFGHPFDKDGHLAATGRVVADLLSALLTDPFFARRPPKSTGRDLFNPDWLARHLATFADQPPVNVLTTLAELSASACAASLLQHAPDSRLLIVCGGGALNAHLMQRIQALLPGVVVASSQAHGIAPMQVEAAAFAWLAHQAIGRVPCRLQNVTGSRGPRVLGAIYPA